MRNPDIFLLPTGLDPFNMLEIRGDRYEVFRLDGDFLGWVGRTIPRVPSEHFYYGWQTPFREYTHLVYDSPSDAANALADYVDMYNTDRPAPSDSMGEDL